MKKKLMLIILPILLIVIDQATKWWVTLTMERGEAGSTTLISGALDLTYVRNPGAAMGMLADHRWVFMSLSILTIIGLTALMIFAYEKFSHLTKIAWVIILAGGIGNMIDRTFYGDELFNGEVIDFIHVRLFNDFFPWIFNFADIFIFCGVALFMFAVVRDEVKLAKKKRAEARANVILAMESGELLEIDEDGVSTSENSAVTDEVIAENTPEVEVAEPIEIAEAIEIAEPVPAESQEEAIAPVEEPIPDDAVAIEFEDEAN